MGKTYRLDWCKGFVCVKETCQQQQFHLATSTNHTESSFVCVRAIQSCNSIFPRDKLAKCWALKSAAFRPTGHWWLEAVGTVGSPNHQGLEIPWVLGKDTFLAKQLSIYSKDLCSFRIHQLEESNDHISDHFFEGFLEGFNSPLTKKTPEIVWIFVVCCFWRIWQPDTAQDANCVHIHLILMGQKSGRLYPLRYTKILRTLILHMRSQAFSQQYLIDLHSWSSSWWFQPIWKNTRQLGSFPQKGMKIKNTWNHHLVDIVDHFLGALSPFANDLANLTFAPGPRDVFFGTTPMPSLKAANKVSSEIKTCHQTEDFQKSPGHEVNGVVGGIWGLLIPYLSRYFLDV